MRKLKLLLAACALFGVTATAWADDVLDITDLYLTNPGFESGDTNGWTVGSSDDTGARSTSSDTYKMSNSEGSFLFNTWWKGIPITQTIESLPAGSYTLTSVVASNGATVYMISGENSDEYEYTETTNSAVGIQLTKNFTLTETTNYKIGAVGGADGTAGEHKDYEAEGYWWYKADNFRLYLNLSEGATIPAAIVQKLLADKPTGTMSTSAQTALDNAISEFENNATLANYNAALEAMANARKSIASLAIIASGTIPLENAVGWGKTTSGSLNYNTWSGEGASDGSNMTTPFIENHISPKTDEVENYLGEGKLYYRLTNLTPGDKYSVSALVRIVSQIGKPISGAYFYANDGKKNIADVSFDCTNGIAGTMYAVGTVDADGVLEIGLESSATSTFNWMAIKDVKIASYAGTFVSSIALSESSVEVRTGDVLNLTVSSISPEGADDKNYTWSSDNENVATVVRGKVLTLNAGSATITATACDGSGVTGTCTITVVGAAAPANWSDIADVDQGDFFIRNVGTGKFLGGANSWGTQASLIKHGIPFGLTKIADGKYTLNSYTYNDQNNHFFNGTYVDGASTDIFVTSLGNGKYALSTADGSAYVSAKAGTTVVDNRATSSDASLAQWQFLSADDMLKNLKDGDTDATFFLSEANISRNLRKSYNQSAWKGEYTWETWKDGNKTTNKSNSGFAYGGANENQCGETIGFATNSYQTVTVPNGKYKLRVQGFYRADEGSEGASYLYANVGGEDITKDLKLLGEEGNANDMSSASALFSEGKYWNELEVTVTNNCLKVGVKTDDTNNWTIWDNFELELTSGGVFNVEPAIADGDYYLNNNNMYIKRRNSDNDERNEGVMGNDDELLAHVTTNTAGITTIVFDEKAPDNKGNYTDGIIRERLFLSTNQVYTDGKRHVEKNYHHHYWAIEAVDGGYRLRNIEDGRYLDVAGEGNPIAVTVSETGAVWTFDDELKMSKNKLAAVIAEANAIYNGGANVGAAAFQIPAAAATTFTTAVNDAKNGSYSTAAEVNAAIAAVEAAILVYQQVELNEPDADKLYNIINVSEGYHHAGKAVTFKSAKDADLTGNTTSMGYNEQPGSIYPQGVKFIKTESRNAYKLCYTRADGNTVYVSTGTLSGLADGNERIRPTTDPDKALVVIVIATQKDGVWNLANTMADKNLGANGADDQGFFTINWYNDMKLQEAVEAEVELTIDATNQYATCILPFDVAIPAGVVAYSVPSVTGSTLNLTEVLTGTLVANTPYVLFAEDGLAETSLKGLGAAYTDATYTEGLLTGVYADAAAPIGSYVLQNQESVVGFYKVAKDKQPTVGANHAYMTIPATEPEARALYFDNATAIKAIEALTSGESEIYDAAGVRQAGLQKGVNIVKKGGKSFKVMLK